MSFFGDLYDNTVGLVVGPNSITGDVYDTAVDLVGRGPANLALAAAAYYFLGPTVAAALGPEATAADIASAAGVSEAAVTDAAATATTAAETLGADATAADLAAEAFPDYGTATGEGAAGTTLGDATITGTTAAETATAAEIAKKASDPTFLAQLGEIAKSYGIPIAMLTSGLVGAKTAKSAAQTQADAARQANELAYKIYGEQKALQEPFRTAGVTAQNKLLTYLGLPGGTEGADYGKYARDFGMADFTADPGYAFRMSEGLKGLERSAAARGGLLSGTGLKNIQRFGQDLASQEYGSAYNRYQTNRANQLNPLGSLLASGQSAAANVGSAAGQYGATAGSNITGAGAATAAGQVGSANALTNALSSYLNYSSNQDLVNALTRRSAYGAS